MVHARHVTLALTALMLIARPALAQPPVGLPSTTAPTTGPTTTQGPIDPRTRLRSPLPSTGAGSPLTTPAPPQPPPPIPRDRSESRSAAGSTATPAFVATPSSACRRSSRGGRATTTLRRSATPTSRTDTGTTVRAQEPTTRTWRRAPRPGCPYPPASLETLERNPSLVSARLGELLERINVSFASHPVYVHECCRRTTIGLDDGVRDTFRGQQHLIGGGQSHATDQRIHSDQRDGVLQCFIQRIDVQVRCFFDELRIQLFAMRHIA